MTVASEERVNGDKLMENGMNPLPRYALSMVRSVGWSRHGLPLTLLVVPMLAAALVVPAAALASPSVAVAGASATVGSAAGVAGDVGDEVAQRWVARYDGPAGENDGPGGSAMSPDGSMLYVTGGSIAERRFGQQFVDYATVAYDTATGEEVWVARYDAANEGVGVAVAVSPDGSTVFVTGYSSTVRGGDLYSKDYATVAYDAATGEQLWVARYDGGDDGDVAAAVAVTPDGATVVVTGSSGRDEGGTYYRDYATVAYDGATGERRWVVRYRGEGLGDARTVVSSGDGSVVYVAGRMSDKDETGPRTRTAFDLVMVAYDAATGEQRWVSRYQPPSSVSWHSLSYSRVANYSDAALSPDGSTLYVTGSQWSVRGLTTWSPPRPRLEFVTVAVDTATGEQRWVSTDDPLGAGDHTSFASGVAVSPDGSAVYVTGRRATVEAAAARDSGGEFATVAYDAATGQERWVAAYDVPRGPSAEVMGDVADTAWDVVVSPDGAAVYVTGGSGDSDATRSESDVTTVAYDAATGDQVWVGRYNGPGDGADTVQGLGSSLNVTPTGSRLFVLANSEGDGTGADYALLAYDTGIEAS